MSDEKYRATLNVEPTHRNIFKSSKIMGLEFSHIIIAAGIYFIMSYIAPLFNAPVLMVIVPALFLMMSVILQNGKTPNYTSKVINWMRNPKYYKLVDPTANIINKLNDFNKENTEENSQQK